MTRQAAATCNASCPAAPGTCVLCATADTTVYSGTTRNNGVLDAMCVGLNDAIRAALKFNINQLPANITITSATLRVTGLRGRGPMGGCGAPALPLSLYQISGGDVIEAGTNPGSVDHACTPIPSPSPAGKGPCSLGTGTSTTSNFAQITGSLSQGSVAPSSNVYTFGNTNVRDDVQDWRNGTTNRGWLLLASSGDARAVVLGSRNSVEWPTLTVQYKRALGQACTLNSQCGSGFCVDGVCCDNACGALCSGDTCTANASDCRACNMGGGSTGTCTSRHGLSCGSSVNNPPCNLPDTCNGFTCESNLAPAGTTCTDTDGNDCTTALCNGSGSCIQSNNKPAGSACGSSASTDCTAPDTCNGSGVCLPNHAAAGTSCADTDGNDCTVALCNGSGSCIQSNNKPAGSACGSSASTDCTAPDTCNGSGVCLPNHAAAGTLCTDTDGNDCTAALCNGSGSCTQSNNKPAGSPCGSSEDTECTDPDTCNGSGVCLPNHASAITPCTDTDGNDCTTALCSGSGTCVQNNNRPAGTPCAPDTNPCSLDQCNGSGVCTHTTPGNAGVQCRNASCNGDILTQAEVCTGTSTVCPGPNTVDCAGTCTAGACTDCTSDGECGNGRYCSSGACFDKKANGGACTGNNQCTSGFCVDGVCCESACGSTVSAGACTTSPCSGGSDDCMACNNTNQAGLCRPVPETTSCADTDGNECTFAQCNATGTCTQNNNHTNGTPCGSSADTECTNPDTCLDGVCQANHEPNTTSCTDTDGNDCTAALCNGAGACTQNNNRPAGAPCGSNADTDCTNPDTCDGSGVCLPNHEPPGSSCTDTDGEPCTQALCDASGTCVQTNNLPAGTPCTSDSNPCTIDECNDSGTCTHVAGNVGTVCRPAAGVCDVAENCDGTATCPPDVFLSTECRAASCSAGVATLAASCPGNSAACPAIQTEDCFPFACDATACRTSCTTDAHCDADGFCNGTICEPKRSNGVGCDAANQCLSGRCVDGVCCNNACTGQCEACDVEGSVGTCSPVPEGGLPHGEREPCEADGTACDGFCDGQNRTSCAYPGSSTRCRAPVCSAGIATLSAFCNGSGHCPEVQTQVCEPYACDETACFGDCQVDDHCDDVSYCASGVCVPKLELGVQCAAANQCLSGHCIDGVCCDRPCPGQCEACDGANPGLCEPIQGLPHGARPQCVDDPDGSECDGYCDGTVATSCTYPGSGTVCRPASCSDGSAIVGAVCNGSGVCPAEVRVQCPGDCDGVICDGNCTLDSECAPTEYCLAGNCTPKSGNGEPCATGNSCASGLCVDGVCCNDSCTGQCEACNLEGFEGLCLPVQGSPRGTRPACTGTEAPCAGVCDGVNRKGCTYADEDVQCRPASCENGVATLAGFCTGDGRCPAPQLQACHPLDCNAEGTLCAGNCTTNADCAEDQFCSGGFCVAKRPNGTPCGGDAQCESGFCVDGVCCNSACTGQCEACDVKDHVGTCSNVAFGLPHGGRPSCGGVGPCTARCTAESSTQCTFPGPDVACGSASCIDGVATSAPVCNGAGTCLPPTTKSCGRFVCGEDDCLTDCVTSDDCAPGNECVAGACVPEMPSSGGSSGSGGTLGEGGAQGGTGAEAPTGGAPIGGAPNAGGATGSGSSSGDDGGCGCRTPARRSPGLPGALGALALLGLAVGRRRAAARAALTSSAR